MEKVRKFRWKDSPKEGFDVVGDKVYHVRDGDTVQFPTQSWTVRELEGLDADPDHDLEEIHVSLHEKRNDLVKIQKTRVLLVKGEVTEYKDAVALRDALTDAINEWNTAGWL